MKNALLVTDGSIDLALSLNRWLETQPEHIDLTVVYAYSLNQPTGQSLKAATYREAKQIATKELANWTTFLPKSSQFRTELLLGESKQVLTIHLLLRRYDYLLTDNYQLDILSTFNSCQRQIDTQLCLLNPTKEPVYSLDGSLFSTAF
jgi:hypothetical protein